MAKAPEPGLVKTRLVPPLTFAQAAELSKALLVDQLEHVSNLHDADLYLAFAPKDAGAAMASLAPPGFQRFPQQGDDLGARMAHCLGELRRRGHRNLVLIGGDLPPVPMPFFAQAFAVLANARQRVLLGPSRDGGYYLVGMNRPTPEIFTGMTWSHAGVLAQSVERLKRLGIDYTLLPQWFDVDAPADLDALQAIRDPALLARMKRTRIWLERLVIAESGKRSD